MKEAATSALGRAHVPWGTEGEGTYSASTLGCFSVIESSSVLALTAMREIPLPENAPIRIVDYGTADGGTSLALVKRIIEAARVRRPDGDIEMCYEDQPNNDWRSLFYHCEGLRAVPGAGEAFTISFPKVYVLASGRSLHEQCFPSKSVHFGMSFTAMHWLSEKPCNITSGVHATQATGAEQEAFAAQAATNWEKILLARSAELSPGGRLVIANFAVSPEKEWLGHTKEVDTCMFSTFAKIWKEMADEGLITQEERDDATFINYYRNEKEMRNPLQPGSAVYESGLRLLSLEFRRTPCPFRQAWIDRVAANGGKWDEESARKHAQWYIPTLRTWSNSTFYTALSESREEAERKALVEELYKRYETLVAQDPSAHGMDYVHAFMVLEKIEQ